MPCSATCVRPASVSRWLLTPIRSLDSYVYGFALTRMNLPFENGGGEVADVAESMLEPFPVNTYPSLVEFITEHAMKPGYQYSDEFEYGLDLILDGLERARAR